MPTIDSLELEVQSSSQSAVSGIDALSASLSRLKTAVKGGVGLTSVTNQLKNLNTALNSVDASAADKLNTLANSLEKLKNLGNLKISSSIASQIASIGTATRSLNGVDFSSLGELATAIQPLASIGSLNLSSTINQLNKLPAAIGALNGVDMASTAGKIRELVTALTPLSTIGNSNLGSFFSQIRKLPEMVQTLNGVDLDGFAERIRRLASAIAPLASQLNGIASVFDRIPERILRIILRMDDLTDRNNRASNSYVNLWAKCRMAMTSLQTAARTIASWVTQSNSYIENLNLFTASMGKYAEQAQEYAETVGEIVGIDPGEWMRNQGVFMTITKGFGVASDRAYIMSKNLTQLGYDLSSFFNIPFEDAMQKLQSGISGELEPLRRLGYDLSQARLKAVALSLGIKKSFNDMTQAEKAQLRYYTIMKQVTLAQGDMARTLEAPANQLRILQAQVTQCARALGNIFIPAINAVLPYAIALMKVLRSVADSIALFFGFTLPEVDYSGLGEVTDSVGGMGEELEDATKAAKKLKNAVVGIDELNIISPNDSSGNGSGGVGEFDFDLPEYDFLGDALSERADKIQKWMEKILPLVAEIGAGLAAWAIADSLMQTNISNLDGVTSDFAAASQLVSEIFDINENAHASNYELELMKVKVDVLNGMNIKGLSLSIDETTGRVKESRQEVEKLIESLQKEAQMEAMKELLVETYKDLARAQADSVQALKDYDSAASKLAETSDELANCPWYDLMRRSELTAAQKEQTQAVKDAQQAYATSRDTIDSLTGTIDLYSGQIVDMKLAEVGVGDELVNGLGDVKYSLEETAASMSGYGENIAEGLREGVDKNTKEKEYKSIWTRIGDWFKNLFGIHSPSTVFASYGEFLILGLFNGMLNILGNVGDWIKKNILDPIGNAIKNSPVGEIVIGIKNTASEWWKKAKGWWEGVSKNGVSVEAGVELAKKGWNTVTGWIGELPVVSQAVGLVKSGWETVTKWMGDFPVVNQAVSLAKSGWTTVKNWVGNIPTLDQAIKLAKNGWFTVRDWIGNIPVLDQGIKLIKSGWTTVKNFVGNIPVLDQGIKLVKSGWQTVRTWIGNIPTLDQAIQLVKSGWTTVKNWVGNIPTLDQAIKLIKSGWTTVSNWVGNIPVLSQAISLAKSGWTTVKSWIGYIPTIEQMVSLAKYGWSSLSSWIGTSVSVGVSLVKSGWNSLSSWIGNKVSVGVELFKSGWNSIKSFFGLSSGGYNTGHGWKFFEKGGYIDNGQAQFWKSIPMYKNGTTNAGLHGSMFVAGENGAEMVGHINGQTEVLNRSQISIAMENAVVKGMGQYVGYWRSLNSQMAICSNAVIRSILVSADVLNSNMTSRVSYDPTNALTQSVFEDSQRGYDAATYGDTLETSMRDFYREYVEPTLKSIASDVKRQADKEEKTIVQVGNRTITDAVTTQQKANGFSFTT